MQDTVKISDIAADLGYEGKEIVAKALELGIDVKNATSRVSVEDAEAIFEYTTSGVVPASIADRQKRQKKPRLKKQPKNQLQKKPPPKLLLKKPAKKVSQKQHKKQSQKQLLKKLPLKQLRKKAQKKLQNKKNQALKKNSQHKKRVLQVLI